MDFKKQMDTIAAAERGFTYTVKDFDDEDTDCTIDVIGVGSRIFKQAKQRIDNAESVAAKRGKALDEETTNEMWIDLLTKCTKGWTNVEDDGKKIEFSYDNAVMMYTSYPALRNQVLAAIHDIKGMLEGK